MCWSKGKRFLIVLIFLIIRTEPIGNRLTMSFIRSPGPRAMASPLFPAQLLTAMAKRWSTAITTGLSSRPWSAPPRPPSSHQSRVCFKIIHNPVGPGLHGYGAPGIARPVLPVFREQLVETGAKSLVVIRCTSWVRKAAQAYPLDMIVSAG